MRAPSRRGVGLHPRRDAEHAGVQLVVAGQVDLDVADGGPLVVVQVLLDKLGEGVGELCLPRLEAVVVARRQRHPVPVGAQHLAVAHDVLAVGGLALQRRADLDRLDLSLEDPRECAADETLESALEALSQAHRRSSVQGTRASARRNRAPLRVARDSIGHGRSARKTALSSVLPFRRCHAFESTWIRTSRASGGMADAHGSGPCVRKDVGVQLPPCPPAVAPVCTRCGRYMRSSR